MSKDTWRYRPALDGIRAVAVVAVLLYHAGLSWARGGFLGVDVFFVLSGYLITSLLVREWSQWHFLDLTGFYVRRARRLLPALVLVVIAVGIWAAVWSATDKRATIRADGIASLLYVANWRFVLAHQSYFDQFGDPSPFRHMWSLAIEEQYYLFFPLLLLGLLRVFHGRRAGVAAALAGVALFSAVEMAQLYHPGTDPSRVYYGTDTRIQELMIGSVLGLLLVDGVRLTRRERTLTGAVAAPAALLGLLWAFATRSDREPFLYQGGFALVCLTAALLIAAVELRRRGPVARALGWAPVVTVGKVSYGLYIWHWPIYVALSSAHVGFGGTALVLLRLAASGGAATASYVLVEQPVRQGRLLPRLRRLRPSLGWTATVGAMPLALGVLLAGTAGATAPQIESSPFGGVTSTTGTGTHGLLLVGDSVALSLARGFDAGAYPQWRLSTSVKLGCGILSDQTALHGHPSILNRSCDESFSSWRHAVSQVRPAAVVMNIGTWELSDQMVGGRILEVGSRAYRRYLDSRLELAHRVLTPRGVRLFVDNVPCFSADATSDSEPLVEARNDPRRRQVVNSALEAFVARHANDTTLLDLAGHVCPGGRYTPKADGQQVRYDGVHFTRPGAAQQWRWIMPTIVRSTRSDRTRS